MPKLGKRAAAEQAGTFVERGSDVGGFLAPQSKSLNTAVVNGKTMTTPYSVKQINAPVTNPGFVAAVKAAQAASSSVSTNVSPGPQVQGVKPSYSVTPGGPYTGGSLKI